MEHERTIEEIRSLARKKAKAYSVTVMTALLILVIAVRYLEKQEFDSILFALSMTLALVIGLLVYLKVKSDVEFDEMKNRELMFEEINLSQVKDVLVEPLEETKRISELKEEGAKFYARLTFGNNICILVKHKDGEIQNYSWLKKGRFRENYRIVSP